MESGSKLPTLWVERRFKNLCWSGLTLEQSTDVRTLKRELEKLERQLRELSLTHRTRYLPKNITDQRKEQLSVKVTLRDELLEQTDALKMHQKKMKGMKYIVHGSKNQDDFKLTLEQVCRNE